ncbi:MAG TPA: hypothetical protein VNM14_02650 [Planctomycetota bacterium]|nr:hypothetical protein [Planctomycetota bacterium]
MKENPTRSGFSLSHFWAAISVGVGALATAWSPVLLAMIASRCSGREDPTHGMFFVPALPAISLISALGLDSMVMYCFAIGASYGILCYLLGLPAILIRRAYRR